MIKVAQLGQKSWMVSNLDAAIGVWRMEANSCTKIGIWETWPFEKTHLVFHQEFDLVNHLCFILKLPTFYENIFNLALLTIGFQIAACKVSYCFHKNFELFRKFNEIGWIQNLA